MVPESTTEDPDTPKGPTQRPATEEPTSTENLVRDSTYRHLDISQETKVKEMDRTPHLNECWLTSNPYRKSRGGGMVRTISTTITQDNHQSTQRSPPAPHQNRASSTIHKKKQGPEDLPSESQTTNTHSTLRNTTTRQSVTFAINRNEIKLKEHQCRPFVHQYDLKIETKKTDSEEECEKLILKQLQLFQALIIQVDETALIPPYLTLDRNVVGFKDLSSKVTVATLRI